MENSNLKGIFKVQIDFETGIWNFDIPENTNTTHDIAIPLAGLILKNESLYKIIRVAMAEVDRVQDVLYAEHRLNDIIKTSTSAQ